MKFLSPMSPMMCALFVAVLAVGSTCPAYAQSIGSSLSAASAQDGAQDSNAPSIAGTWQLSFTGPQGNARQATLQVQQKGSTLSGSFQGERGSGSLTGSIQGTQVSMTVKGHGREISFTGTVDGNKMSGTTGQGSSWSATRQ